MNPEPCTLNRIQSLPRRTFIKWAGATALAAVPACAPRPFTVARPQRRFARVIVSPERIIRTIAGLRPYRPSGFVLRAERFGEKLLVHDYGHGGGGVTLSWGTARLAIDELAGWTGPADRAAVVGCGAVGLATARLLQRRGATVTIYAKDVPPNTTSNIAGAQWGPFSVFERGKTTAAFDEQFGRAAQLAWRLFQELPGPTYGIRWIENYSVGDTPDAGPPQSPFYVNGVDLGPREHPFPARYVRRFTTMLIEPPIYMTALLRDFLLAAGRLVIREFTSRDEMLALDEPVIFNCTGLGARALVADDELMPVKGQLTFLLPQPEIDYITLLDGPLYMFPRSDGILLGGTFERGNWSLEPDPEAEKRILEGHRRFFEAMVNG
ncbi:MAG: FAD-dependent oxidoreductase [Vicinamibacterales bacterium]